MKIVHFTPFAPNGSGLYEAARDMAIADTLAGHSVHIVDTGTRIGGRDHEAGKAGKEDFRGGVKIVSSDPVEAVGADVFVAHTGMPTSWVEGEAPIIWMLHGRPAACFRHEQVHEKSDAYSVLHTIAKWPRVKRMVTFWPHHVKYWTPFVPEEKLVCFDSPPVDENRFSPDGERYDFGEHAGKINILIADTCREDINLYEIAHGAIEFARKKTGAKFHFFGMNTEHKMWGLVFQALADLGGLGEIQGRHLAITDAYRAADILLSPHKITTRAISEALCCGTPVIAGRGNPHATLTAVIDEPVSVSSALTILTDRLKENKKEVLDRVSETAKEFSLGLYSSMMFEIYREIGGK